MNMLNMSWAGELSELKGPRTYFSKIAWKFDGQVFEWTETRPSDLSLPLVF